jgi:hypothetical protein
MKEKKRKSITVSVHIYAEINPCGFHMHCRSRNRTLRRLCPEWMTRSGWCNRKPPIHRGCCVLGAMILARHLNQGERGKKNVVKIRDVGNPDNKNKGLLYQYRWSKRTIKDKKSMPEKTKDNGWVLLVYKYMYMGHVAAWVNDVKLDSVGVQRQANRHIFHTVDYVRKPNVRRYTSQSI